MTGTPLAPGFPFPASAFLTCPHSSVIPQYRNLHLLSIGYDSRPRLRPRLTQGRSALPWKPWIFGLKDSHLYLATHSGILSSMQSTAPYGTASSRMQCSSTNLSVSHRPVFLLNSCLSLFSAACSRRHPFSRSYGVILPNSLTMLLPPALGFSPHPPVSVYGTGTHYTIAAFLGTWLTRFTTLFRSTSRLRIIQRICLLYSYPACTGLSIPGSCFPHASLQF